MHTYHHIAVFLLSLRLAYSSPITTVIITTETTTICPSATIPAESLPTAAALTQTSFSLSPFSISSPSPSPYPTSHNCPCDIDDNSPGTATAKYTPVLPFIAGLPPGAYHASQQPYYPISSQSSYNINFYTETGCASGSTGGMAYPTGSGYGLPTGGWSLSGNGYGYGAKPTGTGALTA
ncbi:MAG: hypothetical protein Q9195_002101 [Heterodermia aff. obscurata]